MQMMSFNGAPAIHPEKGHVLPHLDQTDDVLQWGSGNSAGETVRVKAANKAAAVALEWGTGYLAEETG
jgi:hypothetical protein